MVGRNTAKATWGGICVLAFSGWVVPAPDAQAQPSETEVVWHAPAQCPGQDAVEAMIEAYLAASSRAGHVAAKGVIAAGGAPYSMELSVTRDGVSEHYVFHHHSCERLARTVALLTAIAADPLTVADLAVEALSESGRESTLLGSDSESSQIVIPPSATVPSPPQPAPTLAPEGEVAREPVGRDPTKAATGFAPDPTHSDLRRASLSPRAGRPQLWLDVDLGLGSGVLPQAGAQAGGGLGFGAHIWEVGVHGRYFFEQPFHLDGRQDVGAEVQAWNVALRGCGIVPAADTVGIPVCAGAAAGRMKAVPFGLDSGGHTVAHPWVEILLGAGVRWRLHPRVALLVGIEAGFSLYRPIFSAHEPPTTFQTPLFNVQGRIGLAARLW